MNTIKQAFMDGFFAGNAKGGRDAEEFGSAYWADDEDAEEAFEEWMKSIPDEKGHATND